MRSLDKVPIIDREYFEVCLRQVTSFAVWVQVNPCWQTLVPITREVAIEIVERGLKYGGYVWGRKDLLGGCLQISLNSQWLDKLEEK